MGNCPICKDKVEQFDNVRAAHLVIHKDQEGHIHIHGDLSEKEHMKDMIEVAGEHVGYYPQQSAGTLPKEIVFHNRQRIGDMLMFTCAIRDFKAAFPDIKVNVISTASHIWDFNPHIDRSVNVPENKVVKIGPSWLTNKSNSLDWHFTNAYRMSIEQTLGVSIPQGESRPDIYFSEEEYHAKRVIADPYWIICVNGEKGWGCKMYPFVKWQEFVSANPDILFVQIGAKEDFPPRLKGGNVIDYVGKTQDKNTGIRDLFKLFLNAEGSVGLVSFHMHLSGALMKPAVVVAGGREPVSFTRYPGHAYLSTDGMLPCSVKACWHCAINKCTNPVKRLNENSVEEIVPRCVDMIEPEDLTRAINSFYKGGRLSKCVVSQKPKSRNERGPINLVKAPVSVPIIEKEEDLGIGPEKKDGFKFKFGNGAVSESDWEFIKSLIKKHNIRSVLEFGSGYSTVLFAKAGLKVVSYETHGQWIERVKSVFPDLDIRKWNGKVCNEELGRFDLAFVDGPPGGYSREHSTKLASEHAQYVLVHDGQYPFEQQWQAKYLVNRFDGPERNVGRCWFWSKIQESVPEVNRPENVEIRLNKLARNGHLKWECQNPEGRFIKIVSTARGWGGCARSVTTIMELLTKAGHKVEFIPFRNAVTSTEMKAWLDKNHLVKVTENYDTLKEKCDVLFMYADDYVWEFVKPEIVNAFSDIGAERKIMMLNYRRGPVGQVEWTKNWDKYMFLNSGQRDELDKVWDKGARVVLPPCTDLAPFFDVNVNYNHNLRLVRHSSQGDTKFDRNNFKHEVDNILNIKEDIQIMFLPGPSFILENERVKKYGRTANPLTIASFLSKGNCFWYSLPNGYMDMGPRVILEAMASGLPVIADNWGGAKDRITNETGWLCDSKEEFLLIIKNITLKELEKKGKAARDRAKTEFVPGRWVEEILT